MPKSELRAFCRIEDLIKEIRFQNTIDLFVTRMNEGYNWVVSCRQTRRGRSRSLISVEMAVASILFLVCCHYASLSLCLDCFLIFTVVTHQLSSITYSLNVLRRMSKWLKDIQFWFNSSVLNYLICYFSWNKCTVYLLSNQPILSTPKPPIIYAYYVVS